MSTPMLPYDTSVRIPVPLDLHQIAIVGGCLATIAGVLQITEPDRVLSSVKYQALADITKIMDILEDSGKFALDFAKLQPGDRKVMAEWLGARMNAVSEIALNAIGLTLPPT